MVRAITVTHGGELTATPRPHGGLAVRVELPWAPWGRLSITP
ncbi:hypothetical protein [Streptomyces sp. E-08]